MPRLRTFLLFALLSLPTPAHPEDEGKLAWTYLGGRPHLSLEQLERSLGIRSYFDRRRGRLLVEGQRRSAFFTPYGSYAVIDGRFQRLARPLVGDGGKYFLDGALLQSHPLPILAAGDR